VRGANARVVGHQHQLIVDVSDRRVVLKLDSKLVVDRADVANQLDDLGLEAALAGLVEDIGRQTEIRTAFERELGTDVLPQLSDELQLVTYRVAQEALSNAVRHSDARHIRVRLRLDERSLELRVSDDGTGFDVDRTGPGLGLAGMRERALLVGAALEIDSGPGIGTRVRLWLPIADDVN